MTENLNIGKNITVKRIKVDKDEENSNTSNGSENGFSTSPTSSVTVTSENGDQVESEYAFEFIITHLNPDLTVEKEEIVRVRKSNEKRYTCKFCRRTSKDHADLMGHVKVHYKQTDDGSTLFCCLDCDNRPMFTLPMKLIHHYGQAHRHITRELNLTKCPQCNVEFPDFPTFERHSQMRANNTIIKCGICPEKFNNYCFLNVHNNRCHNMVCSLCNLKFTVTKKLLDHRRTVHKLFDCLVCQANGKKISFRTNANYLAHFKESHEHMKVTVTPCRYCNASFNSIEKADNHERRHTAEEKLNGRTCEYCKLVFADRMKKLKHIHSVHNSKAKA